MEKKVLNLSVSKQWFDMISTGEKKEEYREIKPYWVSRLYLNEDEKLTPKMVRQLTQDLIKFGNDVDVCQVPYTHVLFINGYGDDKPRIEKEIESISIGNPKKGWCPDEFLDKEYFVIKFK